MSQFGTTANGSIRVIAELKAKSGHGIELGEILKPLVAPSRLEAGCELYLLHEDQEHPGTFYTYEEWTSRAALDAHLNGTAKSALAKAKSLLDDGLKLHILQLLA